jgi:hypothetical protein
MIILIILFVLVFTIRAVDYIQDKKNSVNKEKLYQERHDKCEKDLKASHPISNNNDDTLESAMEVYNCENPDISLCIGNDRPNNLSGKILDKLFR